MASVVETLDTEVPAKARRRRLTAEYKQRTLRGADRCQRPVEIGALLRHEGLYFPHTVWRSAHECAEREVSRWKRRAEQAEAPVEVHKKLSTLLGIDLDENGERR